jgi:hypothetical protein
MLGLYPNGYQPWMRYHAKDAAVVGGVRFDGDTAGKLDVALSYGANETARDTYNTANPSYGAASPTHFYLGSWKSDSTSLTADYLNTIAVSGLEDGLSVSAGCWRAMNAGAPATSATRPATGGPLAGQTVGSLYPAPRLQATPRGFRSAVRPLPASSRRTPARSRAMWPVLRRFRCAPEQAMAGRRHRPLRALLRLWRHQQFQAEQPLRLHPGDCPARHGQLGLPRAEPGGAGLPEYRHHQQLVQLRHRRADSGPDAPVPS